MRAAIAAILAGVSIFAFGLTASAERGDPPVDRTSPAGICAGYGLDNYFVKGDTLYCYDYIGRGSTWVTITPYPVELPPTR